MSQKMKSMLMLVSACGLLMLTGCNVVYSVNPVGDKPAQLDAAHWDGNWLGSEGVLTIKVTDAEHGLVAVAWIEDMELQQYQAQLLESGDWLFFNIKDEKEGQEAVASEEVQDSESDGYFWGRIKNDGDSIILWDPEISKFRALVTGGVLPGEARKSGKNNERDSDVILGELSAEHLKIIISGDEGVLFDWDNPLVLIRLSE